MKHGENWKAFHGVNDALSNYRAWWIAVSGRAPAFGLVTMTLGDHNCPATSSTRMWGCEETGGQCGARCGPAKVGRATFVRAGRWALIVAGLGAGAAW